MIVDNIIQMNTGDGDTSYAKNSGLQRVVILKTLPVLEEALEEMLEDSHLISEKSYKVVDFGCASGPNSLWVMKYIMDTIESICKKKNVRAEIEGYLNDLPNNDFNNLFKCLTNLHREKDKAQRFFYGLPGSFYGRLFSKNTLHVAYSSYALHWLSQVPVGLEIDNKENIYVALESSPQVLDAYANQFQRDFSTFLRLRAEEMVQGGCMILSFRGRSDENGSTSDDSTEFTLLAETLHDMVIEGIVKREDLYSFNLPHYTPCKSEVRTIVEKAGSFTLDKIDDFRVPWDVKDNYALEDGGGGGIIMNNNSGKLVAHCIRAVTEPMITQQFGSSIIDGLFDRYAKKVGDHMSVNKPTHITIVISMTRN